MFPSSMSSSRTSVSAPRENVPYVPSRNVPLTESGWGGDRRGSSHHDPAGERPPGSAQEGTEEADQTIAGSEGAGAVSAAGEATAARTTNEGGQSRHSRPARPAVEPQDQRRAAGRNCSHSF